MNKLKSQIKSTKIYGMIRYYVKYRVSKKRINYTKGFFKSNPLNVEEWSNTIDRIVNNKLSLARFGDGEYYCMTGLMNNKFSALSYCNKLIKNRLIEVFTSNSSSLIIAIIPSPSEPYGIYNDEKKYYWNEYNYSLRFNEIINLLDFNKYYGDATIFLKSMRIDPNLKYQYFNKIRSIWFNREVCFVRSKQGRLDVNHYLFNNVALKEFIDVPATNAFSKYDLILSDCLKKDKKTLFLLSAGFTATLLAFDLSNQGYQAIDIGHITYKLDTLIL